MMYNKNCLLFSNKINKKIIIVLLIILLLFNIKHYLYSGGDMSWTTIYCCILGPIFLPSFQYINMNEEYYLTKGIGCQFNTRSAIHLDFNYLLTSKFFFLSSGYRFSLIRSPIKPEIYNFYSLYLQSGITSDFKKNTGLYGEFGISPYIILNIFLDKEKLHQFSVPALFNLTLRYNYYFNNTYSIAFGYRTDLNLAKYYSPKFNQVKSYFSTILSIIEIDNHNLMIIGKKTYKKSKKIRTWIAKLDSKGNIIWEKFYYKFYPFYKNHLLKIEDNNYIFCTKNIKETYISQIDKNGVVFTENKFKSNKINDIIQSEHEKYIVVSSPDIIKLNQNAEFEWKKSFKGNFNSICKTKDDAFITAGEYKTNDSYRLSIIKFNDKGDIIWNKYYNKKKFTYGGSIVQADDNHFIIASATYDYGGKNKKIWILKINLEGNIITEKLIDDYTYSQNITIKFTKDKNIILLSSKLKTNEYLKNILIIKFDNDLNILWEKVYHSKDNTVTPEDIIQINDKGFIIVGNVVNYKRRHEIKGDAYILKINKKGDKIWEKIYNDY